MENPASTKRKSPTIQQLAFVGSTFVLLGIGLALYTLKLEYDRVTRTFDVAHSSPVDELALTNQPESEEPSILHAPVISTILAPIVAENHSRENSTPLIESRVKDPDFGSEIIIPASATLGRMMIPALGVEQEIVDIPIINQKWDISELGGGIGLLDETGKHPGDERSMVFAAHATTYWPIKGPFGDLFKVEPGSEILYVIGSQTFVYEISLFKYIDPSESHHISQHDGNKIILLTCNDFDLDSGLYRERLIVEATFVEVRES